LNISGNAGVTVTTLTGVKFASIDASGVTAGLVSFTTGALTSAASIKGGAAANTIVATAATKAVTYTGQEKVDTITINNALDNVVNTAGGNDIIVTGSGADTINAGSGNDTITAGAGLNVVTGGAGDDSHGIALQASGNVYTTITDFAVGDSINLGGLDEAADAAGAAISNTTDLGAKITLADTAAFADYLAAATAANSSAAALVKWFQFGGNTFVVVDDEAAASAVFDNGVDTVIRLTGTIDLSKANLTGAVLTLDA
jgi:S-layer protein